MSAADHFLSLFDEQGRYKNGDGEVGVTFLTQSGSQYPGRLRFKRGLLVSAAMDRAGPWGYPEESPLDGLKFLLHFQNEKPRAVFVEQGRVVHSFEFEVLDRVSKEEFLKNVRIARNLFAHPRVESDSPTLDTGSITDALIRSALWLTPRAVEGFNAADFPELKADRQAELLNAVQTFKAVASQVPADKLPTKEQYGDAATAFIAILNLLSPYLPTSEESKKVERALRNVPFPSWVVNWDYELGSSEEGDAAVWVNVFAEGNVARSDYGRFVPQIIPMIRQALEAEGVRRWPYVRLRTAAEYKTA
jgi:hypothetical protein